MPGWACTPTACDGRGSPAAAADAGASGSRAESGRVPPALPADRGSGDSPCANYTARVRSRGSERFAIELTRHDGHSRLALAVVAARPRRSDALLAVLNVACTGARAEWTMLVRSDLKGRGLGTFLLDELLRRAPRARCCAFGNVLAALPDACIVASVHRLILLGCFDRPVVMEAGHVVDVGTADELHRRQPLYLSRAGAARGRRGSMEPPQSPRTRQRSAK